MLNGWFTVAAQAVNFVILVWLLKHFLYRPILQAIGDREKGIAAKLAQADKSASAAQVERDDLARKNADFARDRQAMLATAAAAATTERDRLLAQVHQEIDAVQAKQQQTLRSDQQRLSEAIVRWTHKEVFDISRKALLDLGSVRVDEAISEAFLGKLLALTGDAKAAMLAALGRSAAGAVVRSAVDLPTAQKTRVASTIRQVFGPQTPVAFQIDPELISGVQLAADGHELGWSIQDYLQGLETSVAALLHVDSALPVSGANAGPKSKPALIAPPAPAKDAHVQPN